MPETAQDVQPRCRICGCTEFAACVRDGEPCHWVETPGPDGLGTCSACLEAADVDDIADLIGLARLKDYLSRILEKLEAGDVDDVIALLRAQCEALDILEEVAGD